MRRFRRAAAWRKQPARSEQRKGASSHGCTWRQVESSRSNREGKMRRTGPSLAHRTGAPARRNRCGGPFTRGWQTGDTRCGDGCLRQTPPQPGALCGVAEGFSSTLCLTNNQIHAVTPKGSEVASKTLVDCNSSCAHPKNVLAQTTTEKRYPDHHVHRPTTASTIPWLGSMHLLHNLSGDSSAIGGGSEH